MDLVFFFNNLMHQDLQPPSVPSEPSISSHHSHKPPRLFFLWGALLGKVSLVLCPLVSAMLFLPVWSVGLSSLRALVILGSPSFLSICLCVHLFM